MKNIGLMTAVAGCMATGVIGPEGHDLPGRRVKQPKEVTQFDLDRIEKARLKRERKKQKRAKP